MKFSLAGEAAEAFNFIFERKATERILLGYSVVWKIQIYFCEFYEPEGGGCQAKKSIIEQVVAGPQIEPRACGELLKRE